MCTCMTRHTSIQFDFSSMPQSTFGPLSSTERTMLCMTARTMAHLDTDSLKAMRIQQSMRGLSYTRRLSILDLLFGRHKSSDAAMVRSLPMDPALDSSGVGTSIGTALIDSESYVLGNRSAVSNSKSAFRFSFPSDLPLWLPADGHARSPQATQECRKSSAKGLCSLLSNRRTHSSVAFRLLSFGL